MSNSDLLLPQNELQDFQELRWTTSEAPAQEFGRLQAAPSQLHQTVTGMLTTLGTESLVDEFTSEAGKDGRPRKDRRLDQPSHYVALLSRTVSACRSTQPRTPYAAHARAEAQKFSTVECSLKTAEGFRDYLHMVAFVLSARTDPSGAGTGIQLPNLDSWDSEREFCYRASGRCTEVIWRKKTSQKLPPHHSQPRTHLRSVFCQGQRLGHASGPKKLVTAIVHAVIDRMGPVWDCSSMAAEWTFFAARLDEQECGAFITDGDQMVWWAEAESNVNHGWGVTHTSVGRDSVHAATTIEVVVKVQTPDPERSKGPAYPLDDLEYIFWLLVWCLLGIGAARQRLTPDEVNDWVHLSAEGNLSILRGYKCDFTTFVNDFNPNRRHQSAFLFPEMLLLMHGLADVNNFDEPATRLRNSALEDAIKAGLEAASSMSDAWPNYDNGDVPGGGAGFCCGGAGWGPRGTGTAGAPQRYYAVPRLQIAVGLVAIENSSGDGPDIRQFVGGGRIPASESVVPVRERGCTVTAPDGVGEIFLPRNTELGSLQGRYERARVRVRTEQL
ncbi:hypothetical protein C8R44DRAFT_724103 [Mycena epipterygia]|nr:hypothetical protein C8R44DRAFT_724103 [Mycena epipterygia]